MKNVIVKGYLYVTNEGTSYERYCTYEHSTLTSAWMRLIMPLNFEVAIPEDSDLTPVKVLADESEFLAMRMKLQDERMGVSS